MKGKGKNAEKADKVRLSVTLDAQVRAEFIAFCRQQGRASYRWHVVERLIRWFLAQPPELQGRLLDPRVSVVGLK